MKKFLLALAMFFTLAIGAQEKDSPWTGIWYGAKGDYHLIILNNPESGYKFINFSFGDQKTIDEYFLSEEGNNLKTKIEDLHEGNVWNVNASYTIVNDYSLLVEFSGDYENTLVYHKQNIYAIE